MHSEGESFRKAHVCAPCDDAHRSKKTGGWSPGGSTTATGSARPQQIKVDVRCDEQIDTDYAAAIVAVRTGTPLADVIIIDIREPDQ